MDSMHISGHAFVRVFPEETGSSDNRQREEDPASPNLGWYHLTT